MLINGKPEELKKYSKGTYSKELFILAIKDRWELTDLQIRMTYLISDLAEKAQGAFSVSYGRFLKMFEERFEMEVSLSSVRRFFGILSKIGVLTVNEAKRKNNKRSANIYIIEPLTEAQEHEEEHSTEQAHEQENEHLIEHALEHIDEHHNITKKNTLNTHKNTINLPLTITNRDFIDHQLKDKYPHVSFVEVKQQVLNDTSLTINNVNQYKGILEYKLKNWKPCTPKQRVITRKEKLPDWWEDDYYERNKPLKPEMTPEELEAKKAEIQAILVSLRAN